MSRASAIELKALVESFIAVMNDNGKGSLGHKITYLAGALSETLEDMVTMLQKYVDPEKITRCDSAIVSRAIDMQTAIAVSAAVLGDVMDSNDEFKKVNSDTFDDVVFDALVLALMCRRNELPPIAMDADLLITAMGYTKKLLAREIKEEEKSQNSVSPEAISETDKIINALKIH